MTASDAVIAIFASRWRECVRPVVLGIGDPSCSAEAPTGARAPLSIDPAAGRSHKSSPSAVLVYIRPFESIWPVIVCGNVDGGRALGLGPETSDAHQPDFTRGALGSQDPIPMLYSPSTGSLPSWILITDWAHTRIVVETMQRHSDRCHRQSCRRSRARPRRCCPRT